MLTKLYYIFKFIFPFLYKVKTTGFDMNDLKETLKNELIDYIHKRLGSDNTFLDNNNTNINEVEGKKPMTLLEEFAGKVAAESNNLPEGAEAALSPEVLGVFAEMIIELIMMIQECRAGAGGEEVKEMAGNIKNQKLLDLSTRMMRIRLNNAVRRQVGFLEFRRNGEKIVNSLLDTTESTDTETLNMIMRGNS